MLGIGDTLLSRCLPDMSYFRYGCSYVPHQVVVVVVVVVVVIIVYANETGEYNFEFRAERPGYDFYSSRNSSVYRDIQND
jgi:hypothetical protein